MVKVKLIKGGKLPEFKTDGAVCLDCYSREEVKIPGHDRALVPLGFALQLPQGFEAVIRPRSGLTKNGIDNAIGTIDSDYRGEVMACVINNCDGYYVVMKGDRVCQMAIREVPVIQFEIVDELDETERGSGGFGHTGK